MANSYFNSSCIYKATPLVVVVVADQGRLGCWEQPGSQLAFLSALQTDETRQTTAELVLKDSAPRVDVGTSLSESEQLTVGSPVSSNEREGLSA